MSFHLLCKRSLALRAKERGDARRLSRVFSISMDCSFDPFPSHATFLTGLERRKTNKQTHRASAWVEERRGVLEY